jgi:SAM-dependent methyltransferase
VQRIITADKLEQRRYLSGLVKALGIKPGSRVLDFGCGTGLFARVFTRAGMEYTGYDIDERLVAYGRRLNKDRSFISSMDELKRTKSFDVVLVNCCFHHIEDRALSGELANIKDVLSDNGTLIVIDIIKAENDPNSLRRIFRMLERGEHIRSVDEYRRFIKKHFKVSDHLCRRSHLFSIKHFPIYNNIAIFVCKK